MGEVTAREARGASVERVAIAFARGAMLVAEYMSLMQAGWLLLAKEPASAAFMIGLAVYTRMHRKGGAK